MKINVDAAVSKNTGLGAVAAVARNTEGVFCGASAVVLPGKTDAETLEALACREALSLAQDINARRIRVASDCLNVVRSTNQGTMGAYAHVVREFKETARELDEVVVVHEARGRIEQEELAGEAHVLSFSAKAWPSSGSLHGTSVHEHEHDVVEFVTRRTPSSWPPTSMAPTAELFVAYGEQDAGICGTTAPPPPARIELDPAR
ncbi:hypothetical protein QYE76_015837 [Lolium multiflorum]|uniref:RNase H type-1 domain-containing protein n=1 Tax=Lolium multiflorum TaxID=4521 RepID=A0AAD8X840_LOLMU|nr:hypothetical protein QYE76_015837 [Lolium multiflorum]